MNILSLFDGISCGRVALERIGIKVDRYLASEIKDFAIKCSKENWQDIEHIGDVTKVRGNDLPHIDLLIGGSPCQDFSSANWKKDGLKGEKSKLFFEYLRILEETKPKYFLLENVGSMKDADVLTITNYLSVYPVRINSALVSAQYRDRLYWTNIPGKGQNLFGSHIEQPEDKSINLIDILEENPIESKKITEHGMEKIKERLNGKTGLAYSWWSDCIRNDKSGALLLNGLHWAGKATTIVIKNEIIRYFTQTELERLQTLPEGYTKMLNPNQAINVIGDGWTVDVICHILQGIK